MTLLQEWLKWSAERERERSDEELPTKFVDDTPQGQELRSVRIEEYVPRRRKARVA